MSRGSLSPLALAYHAVGDVPLKEDPDRLFVRAEDLKRHIARLREWGYRLVSFGELARLAAVGQAGGNVALTFDDGFSDNYETLAPLLAELDAPATVFVVSGWLGKPHRSVPRARVVTAEELRALHAAGIEIGAHSVTHPDLSTLTYEEARSELEQSKRDLERELDAPVEVAAYPYGRASADAVRAARDAGFRAACAAVGLGSWDSPLHLPRQNMTNRCTLIGLRLKRDDLYEPLMRLAPARAVRRLARALR
jgi:peptidoglycan/xylan/chitin deacetylase (PgdA/CDA1 family)